MLLHVQREKEEENSQMTQQADNGCLFRKKAFVEMFKRPSIK